MQKTPDTFNTDQEFRLRAVPLGEVIARERARDEQIRRELGIPTKSEVESSDPLLPTLMCDPFINSADFLAKTEQAPAILLVAFATGAMPDRLVPAIQQRLQQGIPVFVLSNNPADPSGIMRVIYAAGSGAYKAGAVGLQKVNVKDHVEVKAAILVALASGLRGQALSGEIEQRFAYQEGEEVPLAEWDRPDYTDPPRVDIREMLFKGGFTDSNGNYLLPKTNLTFSSDSRNPNT